MKKKNVWVFLLFLLIGVIIGNLIGELTRDVSGLWFLNYGETFGLETPLVLNLSVLIITFGFQLKLTVCGIIGIIVAMIIYKKI